MSSLPTLGLTLCVVLSCSAQLAIAAQPDSDTADGKEWRAWVEAQPPTVDNEILFRIENGEVFRSDRFPQAGNAFGDFDDDGDVDLSDYSACQICLSYSGPQVTTPPPCYVFDSDADLDVDLLDAADFFNVLTGSFGEIVVEAGSLLPVVASPDDYYSGPPGAWGNNALSGFARQAGYIQDDLWYEWSNISKPDSSGEVIIVNSARPETAYSILAPLLVGDYVFRLQVTNLITLELGQDTVTLKVVFQQDSQSDDVSSCTANTCNAGQFRCAGPSDPVRD